MTALRNYLEQMVRVRRTFMPEPPSNFNYWCIEDYTLDRGDEFTSAPLTEDETAFLLTVIDRCSIGRFQQKQCFYNSQMLVLADHSRTLEYVEGYASGNAVIPVHHGWVVLNNKVVDLTFRTEKPNHKGRLRDRIFGTFPSKWAYIGTRMDRDMCRERIFRTQMVGTVLDDWESGYPLLQQDRIAPCSVEPLDMAKVEQNCKV